MILGLIMIVLGFVALFIISQVTNSLKFKIITLILSMEAACVIMALFTGTSSGIVAVVLLSQASIALATFAGLYGEAERVKESLDFDELSDLGEAPKCPDLLRRFISEEDKAIHLRHTLCTSLAVAVGAVVVLLHFALDFSGALSTLFGFLLGGGLFGMALFHLCRLATEASSHPFLWAEAFSASILVMLILFLPCVLIDTNPRIGGNAGQSTEVVYDLRPVEESSYFHSDVPDLYDLDNPDQVHYLVKSSKISSDGDGYFFLSTNSNNLQYVDSKITIEYREDVNPQLIERKDWHITKYWKAFKDYNKPTYHVILPDSSYVLE